MSEQRSGPTSTAAGTIQAAAFEPLPFAILHVSRSDPSQIASNGQQFIDDLKAVKLHAEHPDIRAWTGDR